jgi:hypothetical protein
MGCSNKNRSWLLLLLLLLLVLNGSPRRGTPGTVGSFSRRPGIARRRF